mmetsp:Transcript_9439/g.25118  ORF Transcript_9439/g.25118 Transcript_9439/m.25118 type:complete len:205 (+) Transcript_9439:258-872(+)
MHQILDAVEALLAKLASDDLVVGQRDALLAHLAVATLVDELADRLQAGVAIGHVGLDELKHLQDGLVDLQEDAVVQLLKAQQLEDLPGLGAELDDADDPDHEQQLGLGLHEEVATELSFAAEVDQLLLVVGVLLLVLLGALLQARPLLLQRRLGLRHGLRLLLEEIRVARHLQLDLLGNNGALNNLVRRDQVPGRHGLSVTTSN